MCESQALRLHCSVDVLHVIILLDTFDEFLYVSLCVTLEYLEVYVRETGELCCNKLIAILFDPFLDCVECRELTVEYDFCLFVLVFLLEDLLHAIVDELKLKLLKVVRVG